MGYTRDFKRIEERQPPLREKRERVVNERKLRVNAVTELSVKS